MDDPFIEKVEIDIHPNVLKETREILHFMLEYGYPSIIPQISYVLLSYPFEVSRFDDLVLMVMDNCHLFGEEYYEELAYKVMKHNIEFDLDPPNSDYVLCPFIGIAGKIYTILEKYPVDIQNRLDPDNLGKRIVFQLCKEYLIEEKFIDQNNATFTIYMYDKDSDLAFLKLHFQSEEPKVTQEQKNELLKLSEDFFKEYSNESKYKGFIDR